MRLSSGQIDAIRQEAGHCTGARASVFDLRSRVYQCGFTLVELIMTMVIAVILVAVVAPSIFDADVFRSQGFADQVQAALRYAQKAAIAQHRNACVTTASGTITLTVASLSGAASACDTPLVFSGGGNSIASPAAAITITLAPPAPATFSFDALGKPYDVLGITPSARKSFTVSGASSIIFVEPETGYVHSP